MKKQKKEKPLILTSCDEESVKEAVKEFIKRDRHSRVKVIAESIRSGVVLCQVKCALKHGEFEKWIDENCCGNLPRRTARHHMKKAKAFLASEAAVDFLALSLEDQQAQLRGDGDDGVFMAGVERFLRMD